MPPSVRPPAESRPAASATDASAPSSQAPSRMCEEQPSAAPSTAAIAPPSAPLASALRPRIESARAAQHALCGRAKSATRVALEIERRQLLRLVVSERRRRFHAKRERFLLQRAGRVLGSVFGGKLARSRDVARPTLP